MAEMSYYFWKNGRTLPSFFYNLPQGELTIIRAFYELEVEEVQKRIKLLGG